ncbi:MAG: DUF1824 family protein [Cyanothece sp. SIO1E1]|nr:DUF1824 family protein [Cyanothece sp. SIO1E1]
MSASKSTQFTIPAAQKLLNQFICLQVAPNLSGSDRDEVRTALLLLVQKSDYLTLGICTDTLAQAQHALETYMAALMHSIRLDGLPATEGAVYLKFNTQKSMWYLDAYSGNTRGVLVTCHAGGAEEIVNGTYGPLPLDLFAADG